MPAQFICVQSFVSRKCIQEQGTGTRNESGSCRRGALNARETRACFATYTLISMISWLSRPHSLAHLRIDS